MKKILGRKKKPASLIGMILRVAGLSILIGLTAGYSQITRGGQISLDTDFSRYRANQDWTYLEVDLSFSRANFEYRKIGDAYQADFLINLKLSIGDSLVSTLNKHMVDRTQSIDSSITDKSLYSIFSFFLKKGKYRIQASVKDSTSHKTGWSEKEVDIEPFSWTSLDLSDIDLSNQIVSDTSKNIFVKNGYRITPNVNGLYGIELPVLYYYTEIYNLSPKNTGKDSTYSVQISIQGLNNQGIKKMPLKTSVRHASSLVDVGMVRVSELSSGPYSFIVGVTDNGNGNQVQKDKTFYIYRPAEYSANTPSQEGTNAYSDEFSQMDEKELDAKFQLCKYIVTNREKKLFKKLDLVGKRKFMNEFWKQRDKNEYFQRVEIANAKFSSLSKEGWKKDQGRIYILYGEPDNVDRFPTSMSERAYEIWYYHHLEGGVEFDFVDITDQGEYMLVNSTLRNEYRDSNWTELLNH
jgi:GWxTD domain-containing protein